VDGASTNVVYLNKPFREYTGFAAASVSYDVADLTEGAGIVFEELR
jgi:hypothetical protein